MLRQKWVSYVSIILCTIHTNILSECLVQGSSQKAVVIFDINGRYKKNVCVY